MYFQSEVGMERRTTYHSRDMRPAEPQRRRRLPRWGCVGVQRRRKDGESRLRFRGDECGQNDSGCQELDHSA